MESYIKIHGQTAGKDKVFRFMQYLSRLLWHRLQQGGSKNVDNFKSLEYTFSTFRKLLRFGKCVEAMYSVFPIIDHPDLTVRFTLSLSKISSSLFLLCDHMIWLSRTGMTDIKTEKWVQLSCKYWLYSITMNLIRDFYEIVKILKNENRFICPPAGCKTMNDFFMCFGRAVECLQTRRDVMVDTIKNGCDFFIPLTSLGYTKLSPSVIGALGVISSIAGLLAIVNKDCKLTPI